MASYLKETFPEIANATSPDFGPPHSLHYGFRSRKVMIENVEFMMIVGFVDTSFFQMFDIKLLGGSQDFFVPDSRNLAITQERARQLFGNENPIGKIVEFEHGSSEIRAIVSGMSKQSNFKFDFIMMSYPSSTSERYWSGATTHAIIELFPGTNIKAFEKKLFEHDTGETKGNISKMTMKPITKMRYTDSEAKREIKFQHILIFSLSGLLVILCSLFNYLTLFVSRFRIRQTEANVFFAS